MDQKNPQATKSSLGTVELIHSTHKPGRNKAKDKRRAYAESRGMLTRSRIELITVKEISTNILWWKKKRNILKTCRVVHRGRLEQWGHLSPYRQHRHPLNLPGGICRFVSWDSCISCSACRAEAKNSVKHRWGLQSAHQGAGQALNWPSTHLNCPSRQQQANSKSNPMKGKISLCEGASQISGRWRT